MNLTHLLIPESKRLVSILAYSTQCFLLSNDNWPSPSACLERMSSALPSLLDKVCSAVEHCNWDLSKNYIRRGRLVR
jgi:hypothetical protein